MSHKKQHAVPKCYLKAWLDPNPFKGRRHVWFFEKDGSNPQRRSPRAIFHETDLYTIHREGGERDLVLEQGLSGLESAFVGIREKLARHEKLTTEEQVKLCAFIAAQHVRTPAQRDHLAGQWGKVLEMMDHMREWAKTATPQQLRDAGSLAGGSGPSLGYEDVKGMAEKPLQTMLASQIETQLPFLVDMDYVIMECSTEPGFITSDNPCVWWDPEAYKRPPIYRQPGLLTKTLEISMPLSPRQRIILNWKGIHGYVPVPEQMVDNANRLATAACSQHFVSDSATAKPIWFDPGVEPKDSWEKLHAKSRPKEDAPS
jgi:Protein of unknown function (DUF4238)